MQQFCLVLRDDRCFCSDTACMHSEDTMEVAFAHFSVTLRQEN